MGHFVYFVPGGREGRWDCEAAVKAGLGHAFAPRKPIFACGAVGPDGVRGVALAQNPDNPGAFAAGLASRTWLPIAGTAARVGLDPANPPGPDDLVRDDVLGGEFVVLGDGREWLCPTAVLWDTTAEPITWSSTLARRLALDAEGKVIFAGVVESQQAVWAAAQRIWDARIGAKVDGDAVKLAEMSYRDLVDVAVVALGHNYRIGKTEAVGLLGLLDEINLIEVIDALLDWKTFVDWSQKKTATPPDGSSTAPGPPADCPATARPS